MKLLSRKRGHGPNVWDGDDELRAINEGFGACNKMNGYDSRYVCIFGGLGCDVDHCTIAVENRNARQNLWFRCVP